MYGHGAEMGKNTKFVLRWSSYLDFGLLGSSPTDSGDRYTAIKNGEETKKVHLSIFGVWGARLESKTIDAWPQR